MSSSLTAPFSPFSLYPPNPPFSFGNNDGARILNCFFNKPKQSNQLGARDAPTHQTLSNVSTGVAHWPIPVLFSPLQYSGTAPLKILMTDNDDTEDDDYEEEQEAVIDNCLHLNKLQSAGTGEFKTKSLRASALSLIHSNLAAAILTRVCICWLRASLFVRVRMYTHAHAHTLLFSVSSTHTSPKYTLAHVHTLSPSPSPSHPLPSHQSTNPRTHAPTHSTTHPPTCKHARTHAHAHTQHTHTHTHAHTRTHTGTHRTREQHK